MIDVEVGYMSKVPYASVVSCLMYDMVCTIQDLGQVVHHVCKFMSKLGKCHWEAFKCIFKYLKDKMFYGITFRNKPSDHWVVKYVDLNYGGDVNDIRSTVGYFIT